MDPELLAELEDLARHGLVPGTFSAQVPHAGPHLLVSKAREQQTRHAAGLVRIDRRRAEQTYPSAPPPRRTVSAGQVLASTRRVRWVEVQAAAVEPSGWRLMVPLVALDDAPHAPPLVVTVGDERARVHLLVSAPQDELGEVVDELAPDDVCALQSAVQRLVGG